MAKYKRIGIVRGLYYYEFGTELTDFLSAVGCTPVLSNVRDSRSLPKGIFAPLDGACMPVKAYISHAAQLLNEDIDALLVPRAVKCSRNGFTCPKVIGAPELVRCALRPHIPVIDTRLKGNLTGFLTRTGWPFWPNATSTISRPRLRQRKRRCAALPAPA